MARYEAWFCAWHRSEHPGSGHSGREGRTGALAAGAPGTSRARTRYEDGRCWPRPPARGARTAQHLRSRICAFLAGAGRAGIENAGAGEAPRPATAAPCAATAALVLVLGGYHPHPSSSFIFIIIIRPGRRQRASLSLSSSSLILIIIVRRRSRRRAVLVSQSSRDGFAVVSRYRVIIPKTRPNQPKIRPCALPDRLEGVDEKRAGGVLRNAPPGRIVLFSRPRLGAVIE